MWGGDPKGGGMGERTLGVLCGIYSELYLTRFMRSYRKSERVSWKASQQYYTFLRIADRGRFSTSVHTLQIVEALRKI